MFVPARDEDAARALAAWRQAVDRAEALPPSRLLYDARLTRGLVRQPGTLAVTESPRSLQASLTGPFGSPVATYADGALRGEGLRTLVIEPDALRCLLAGVWKASRPQVRGVASGDALLVWEGAERVEGVLDVSRSRFRSLSVTGPQGKIVATYSGQFDPWPPQIDVEDSTNRARLHLTLRAHEVLE